MGRRSVDEIESCFATSEFGDGVCKSAIITVGAWLSVFDEVAYLGFGEGFDEAIEVCIHWCGRAGLN